MARNKMGLKITGIEEIIKTLETLDADIKGTTEEALKKSHKQATSEIGAAMIPHNKSYDTVRSLVKEANVQWVGSKATVDVGFDIENGGLPSIFLMYGTPKMKKDQKLYNAIYGKKAIEKITEIQSEVFFDAIRKAGG